MVKKIIANGHIPPPSLIIPNDIMSMAVGKFVEDMLSKKEI